MNSHRRGFSLVEMVMLVLVLGLFLTGILSLLSSTMGNFTKQEESIFCAGEASLLITQLNHDFESLIKRGAIPGTFPDTFSQAKAAAMYQPAAGLLAFQILGSGGAEDVQYSFDQSEKSITRNCGTHQVTIGKGRIASFSFYWQILGTDGLVRSFPSDPDTVIEPPLPVDMKVGRCWGKVALTLESPKTTQAGKKQVKQEYRFRVFPVRFNNELRSICAE